MISRWLVAISLALSFSQSLKADDRLEAKLYKAYAEVVEDSPSKKDSLSAKELRQLFLTAWKHPVADVDNLAKYDPKEFIGFCFGRSTTVHLIARKMGLKESSIRKLFIVGDLRSNPKKPEWRFHVTSVVKGPEDQWYAVDPIMTPPLAPGGELKVGEWIKIVKKTWDYKNEAYLYATQATAITPDIRHDAEGKSGKYIVELPFNPDKHRDFKKTKLDGYTAYVPNKDGQSEHFLEAAAEEADNRFLFLSITIEGMGKVSFNNYFVDLLKTFQKPIEVAQLPGAAAQAAESGRAGAKQGILGLESTGPHKPANLHSFRLGAKAKE